MYYGRYKRHVPSPKTDEILYTASRLWKFSHCNTIKITAMTELERLSREVRTLSNKIAKLMESKPTDRLLNLPQVSEQLSISKWTLQDMCLKGEISAVKIGKSWKVKQSEINRYMEKL